jgi:hypothetical protein
MSNFGGWNLEDIRDDSTIAFFGGEEKAGKGDETCKAKGEERDETGEEKGGQGDERVKLVQRIQRALEAFEKSGHVNGACENLTFREIGRH